MQEEEAEEAEDPAPLTKVAPLELTAEQLAERDRLRRLSAARQRRNLGQFTGAPNYNRGPDRRRSECAEGDKPLDATAEAELAAYRAGAPGVLPTGVDPIEGGGGDGGAVDTSAFTSYRP